jgi:hypothetical protein
MLTSIPYSLLYIHYILFPYQYNPFFSTTFFSCCWCAPLSDTITLCPALLHTNSTTRSLNKRELYFNRNKEQTIRFIVSIYKLNPFFSTPFSFKLLSCFVCHTFHDTATSGLKSVSTVSPRHVKSNSDQLRKRMVRWGWVNTEKKQGV